MAYLYLATYDLVKETTGFDYKPLWEAFEAAGGVKTQFSAYLVESGSSSDGVYKYLKKYVDSNDRLMVVEIESRPSWNTGFKGTKALIDKYFP